MTEKKIDKQKAADEAGTGPQGIAALGNPWDKAYAPGEHPPNPLDPKNRQAEQQVGDPHIGQMSDPTPRDRYTVAGQVEQTKEA